MKKILDSNEERSAKEMEVLFLLLQFMRTEIRNRLHARLRMPGACSVASEEDLDLLISEYQKLALRLGLYPKYEDSPKLRSNQGLP